MDSYTEKFWRRVALHVEKCKEEERKRAEAERVRRVQHGIDLNKAMEVFRFSMSRKEARSYGEEKAED